jgi:CxxC-x17-CxxC domain-containing protein
LPFTEKTLTCVDCGQSFPFTVEEQEYHQSRGFTNEPKRCASCRAARRSEDRGGGYGGGGGGSYGGGGGGYSSAPRQMFTVTCAQCGKPAEVPFEPRNDRPVYCRDCFAKRQPTRSRY